LSGLKTAETIQDPELRAEILGRLGRTALELGADAGSLSSAISQIALVASDWPAASATLAELQARVALRRGDRDRARLFVEQAILFESQRPLPVRVPELFLLLAEAEPAQRARHVTAAYAALENIRPKLPRFDPLTEESMFRLHMRRVFEHAADIKLETAGQAGDQIDSVQQIVEAYREAELQSALGSECLPLRSPVRPADLASGEVLLYPLVFDDRIELIIATGGDAAGERRFRRLPPNRNVSRQEIARLAERLTVELNSGASDKWREPARRLYDLLIKPVEAHLTGSSTLAIIPDRTLRGVPFAALLAGDGQYLVQRTALSVAPALAFSQPGPASTAERVSIVAASLQKQVSLPAGVFPALTGTSGEAKIAAMNGAPGRFLEDFTRAQLVEALGGGRVDVLHLATHASFNGRSDRAYIVASDGIIRLGELREMIAQNRVVDEALALLVLSACETAVGDDESSMGLAGAAVQAGALSAVASLWPVDDIGATELMRNFYGSYGSGRSRAHALRDAQLALINKGGENADPFVWAAFTVVGAWR
jgi:CHAT domain-containing protein